VKNKDALEDKGIGPLSSKLSLSQALWKGEALTVKIKGREQHPLQDS